MEFDPLQYYIETHSTPEDVILATINRKTHLSAIHPRMLSGGIQGKFLEFISRMIQPESILEIGTFTGYSAICLARGLKEGGKLVTIEKNDELEDDILEAIQMAGMENKIVLKIGDAKEIISTLNRSFDLVFIDADKKQYCDYFHLTINKINRGGYIIADNVLWGGKVIGEQGADDPETSGILEFNKLVKNDSRVENVILSFRDGISLIRKL